MKENQKTKPQKSYKELEDILGVIQEKLYEVMLNDLDNPDKRSPQLYNAVIKELERNGIDCIPKAGEDADNALSSLLNKVKENYDVSFERVV